MTDSLLAINNYPFNELVNALANKLEDMSAGRPFLNEIASLPLATRINITLTGNLKDVNNLKTQLRHYGLDIIPAEREVEVLVVRDKR